MRPQRAAGGHTLNPYTNAPAGTVGELTVNGTLYQLLKLDNGTFAAQGGDWAVTGCANEHQAMDAIITRVAQLQARP